jgi:methyl-accepting chemotaxis protein
LRDRRMLMKITFNALKNRLTRKHANPSRLKKKLSIYFILIAIVTISVSVQIILEVSSPVFQKKILQNYTEHARNILSPDQFQLLEKNFDADSANQPIRQLRNRMLLMLLVVSVCVIGAFNMFTKDIVVPMELLVDATKKIASGDLNAHAPVVSEDEIGQMANLVNDMNIGLQDMIKQMRRELDNYNVKLAFAVNQLSTLSGVENSDNVLESRRLKISDFKTMLETYREVEKILSKMSVDIESLHSFMDTYSSYSISSDITQKEIDETLSHYKNIAE